MRRANHRGPGPTWPPKATPNPASALDFVRPGRAHQGYFAVRSEARNCSSPAGLRAMGRSGAAGPGADAACAGPFPGDLPAVMGGGLDAYLWSAAAVCVVSLPARPSLAGTPPGRSRRWLPARQAIRRGESRVSRCCPECAGFARSRCHQSPPTARASKIHKSIQAPIVPIVPVTPIIPPIATYCSHQVRPMYKRRGTPPHRSGSYVLICGDQRPLQTAIPGLVSWALAEPFPVGAVKMAGDGP